MRVHLDVLAWLHGIWGVFGVLAGLSLWVLAVGTNAALLDLGSAGGPERAAIWLFLMAGAVFVLAGDHDDRHRTLAGPPPERRPRAALALAVPNLLVVPFGTALGVYTFWVLLNDDARRDFGRPLRGSPSAPRPTLEGA